MEAISGLLGAVIGGILVVLGEVVRRRADSRHVDVERLTEAATVFVAQYGRLVGQLRDAHERALPAGDTFAVRPDRYEVTSRFFMTPGSQELRPTATQVIKAYQHLAKLPSEKPATDEGFSRYIDAEKAFAAQVRSIVRRGYVARG
ncbi:hypothetical protein ACTMTJ_29005 [Phytohabitans sp. LJ34]|uniref:hypothetical protein n=1 Tax=Phytohabitans sp. LJ34 TaxID=3452217 RepID=UPI003F8CD53F